MEVGFTTVGWVEGFTGFTGGFVGAGFTGLTGFAGFVGVVGCGKRKSGKPGMMPGIGSPQILDGNGEGVEEGAGFTGFTGVVSLTGAGGFTGVVDFSGAGVVGASDSSGFGSEITFPLLVSGVSEFAITLEEGGAEQEVRANVIPTPMIFISAEFGNDLRTPE